MMCSNVLSQDKGEEVELQFVTFPKRTGDSQIHLYINEKEAIKVELPTNSLSVKYKVPAQSIWRLGKQGSVSNEEVEFDTYGSVRSTGHKNQLILAIRKGRRDKDGFFLKALSVGANGFDENLYMIYNATSLGLGGILGGQKFSIRPRSISMMTPKADEVDSKGRKIAHARFFYSLEKEKKAKPFYTGSWRLSDIAKTMVFFYHEEGSKRLRVHTIRDYVK